MLYGKTITVVIPTLNEVAGIQNTIRQIPSFVDEILVVDGNSTDGTQETALSLGAKVILEPRRGYGRAFKTAFAHARGEIIATADGDGTYPTNQLKLVMDELVARDLDFVSCARFPLQDLKSMQLKNFIGNYLLTWFANLLWFHRFHDILSGMWVFKRNALALLSLHSDGWNFSQEIKIQAFTKLSKRFGEVHIPYSERLGQTKLVAWKVGLQNLAYFIGMRTNLVKPFSRLFNPLQTNFDFRSEFEKVIPQSPVKSIPQDQKPEQNQIDM